MRACALILLASCAPIAASQPASVPAGCLDIQGQRELLAGIELEAGEQAAKLAACNVQRMAAQRFGNAEQLRADSAESRAVWVPIVSSIASAVAAALATWGIETVVHR